MFFVWFRRRFKQINFSNIKDAWFYSIYWLENMYEIVGITVFILAAYLIAQLAYMCSRYKQRSSKRSFCTRFWSNVKKMFQYNLLYRFVQLIYLPSLYYCLNSFARFTLTNNTKVFDWILSFIVMLM